MRGKTKLKMSWNNDFTVALVSKNDHEIERLLARMPQFTTREEMQCAQALIQEALTYMQDERRGIQEAMQKLKKTRDFIASSEILSSYEKEYRG